LNTVRILYVSFKSFSAWVQCTKSIVGREVLLSWVVGKEAIALFSIPRLPLTVDTIYLNDSQKLKHEEFDEAVHSHSYAQAFSSDECSRKPCTREQ
jgi:hypothetical protein